MSYSAVFLHGLLHRPVVHVPYPGFSLTRANRELKSTFLSSGPISHTCIGVQQRVYRQAILQAYRVS